MEEFLYFLLLGGQEGASGHDIIRRARFLDCLKAAYDNHWVACRRDTQCPRGAALWVLTEAGRQHLADLMKEEK